MTRPDDLCPRPDRAPPMPTEPLVPPIFTSAVYRCQSPQQASDLLSGALPGYVYGRDGHPNADVLSEKCRELHGADKAAVTATGMGALAAAVLALLEHGDHLLVSNQLYGRSLLLFGNECRRLGVSSDIVDTCDLPQTAAGFTSRTKLLVVETITNPLLRVTDISAMARLAHEHGALLLVDNTFAGPVVCRPLELGADLVMESLTKGLNGHSDVNLGLLCGSESVWRRMPLVLSAWGLASSPFDCWLAARGLGTYALRAERSCQNALTAAQFIELQPQVETVHYPGLAAHADHELARRQFGDRSGAMVTFTLRGGLPAARQFIEAARRIPFSPSLGDISTTLSHPESTSHRGMPASEREMLGIFGGTIRLSVGIESPDAIRQALAEGFAGLT